MMGFPIVVFVIASVMRFTPVLGQACGVHLVDIPDPSSESCVAFFRCFRNQQYMLRCPLGQAFHFNRARCRPEAQVDCPLQLQRFQAPFVPHHLRSPQSAQDSDVDIRVVHVRPNTATNNAQSPSTGNIPVSGQILTQQQGGQVPIQGQAPQGQHPQFLLRTADGRVVQVQGQPQQVHLPVQGYAGQGQNGLTSQQNFQGQTLNSQNAPPAQVQYSQGQIGQGHNIPSQQQGQNTVPSQQNFQGQTFQGQNVQYPQQNHQGQTVQGQAYQGYNSLPAQQNIQRPPAQNQNLPYPQPNIQGQTYQGQVQGQSVQGQTYSRQNIPPAQQNTQPLQGGQALQGQLTQGQQLNSPLPSNQGQSVQGQTIPVPQTYNQGQSVQGQTIPLPQTDTQGQPVQGQQLPPTQTNHQGLQDQQTQQNPPPKQTNQDPPVQKTPQPQQSIQDPQTKTSSTADPSKDVQYQIDTLHKLTTPTPQDNKDTGAGQTNVSIFSPSSALLDTSGDAK